MLYNVKLTGFNTDEIIMIDLCMKVLDFDASKAYECVDNMPSIIAQDVEMNRVNEIKAAFEKEGALIEVEESDKVDKTNEQHIAKSLSDTTNQDIMNLKFNPYVNEKNSMEVINNNYKDMNDDSDNNINTIIDDDIEELYNYENPSNENEIIKDADEFLESSVEFLESSVEFLEREKNYLDSNENLSEDIEEKRNIKYGRRSSDVDPRTVNYGRRSTDINPRIYDKNAPGNESLDNDDSYLSNYTNTVIEKKKTVDSKIEGLGNTDVQTPYRGLNDRTKKQSPYGGLSEKTRTESAYGKSLKNRNMTSSLNHDSYGMDGLNERNNQSTYGTNGLSGRNNQSVYGPSGLNRNNQSVYGPSAMNERNNKSVYGVGGLNRNNQSVYGPSDMNEKNNQTDYVVDVESRDALENDSNMPPYSKRLEKNISDNNEVGNIRNMNFKDSNNQDDEKIVNKFEVPTFEESPYQNSTMSFTKQQHFGTIDKDDKKDDLYDLTAIDRNKKNTKNKLSGDQMTCPKCGSAFVSAKKGQGFFGTTKVKYVCEACNYKF